jgi:hypothetical protein
MVRVRGWELRFVPFALFCLADLRMPFLAPSIASDFRFIAVILSWNMWVNCSIKVESRRRRGKF